MILQIIQEKRGSYTRKRRKEYLRTKNILKYQPKKQNIKKLTSDTMPLYSSVAHQPSIIHPGGEWGFKTRFQWLNKLLNWLWLKFSKQKIA